MKKIIKNQYLRISLYAVCVIVASIFFFRISSNSDSIIPFIKKVIGNINSVLTPIFYGLLIAYLMNPIMCFFERTLIKWLKPKTVKHYRSIRTLSIFIVYICVALTCFVCLKFLIPQILNNIKDITNNIPKYVAEIQTTLMAFEKIIIEKTKEWPYVIDTDKLYKMLNVESFAQSYTSIEFVTPFIKNLISNAINLTSYIFNIVIGFVIAFYTLKQKEYFMNGSKRLLYALLEAPSADKVIAFCKEGHELFVRFFVGKFIDSTIIGFIAFVVFSILESPYALLLALIVGVTNMIPYFGPFIGAIPAVVITLFDGLTPAIAIGIAIFIIQQFDGLILGPKILGDSIGLSPFWIISGIIIGGALWGPLGMFFISPVIAVILSNINKWIDKRLSQKAIDIPVLSEDYIALPPPPYTKFLSGKSSVLKKNADKKSAKRKKK